MHHYRARRHCSLERDFWRGCGPIARRPGDRGDPRKQHPTVWGTDSPGGFKGSTQFLSEPTRVGIAH